MYSIALIWISCPVLLRIFILNPRCSLDSSHQIVENGLYVCRSETNPYL